MSAKKHVSRISAESRWQEGIILGILDGGVGASNYAIGTPDGVQLARATKMVPEIGAWDIELLLAVKGLPWDRRRADPAARIRLPAPEVPPEHVLPPPVGEPAGPRSRRVYIGRGVEIRKHGLTIGCPGCMAITAETTAQGHSDECRARKEQKMLEDVTDEGAMRLEEAIRRKRARPHDESGRADVAMEVAARKPIRPVQYGGFSSLWGVGPKPSRRREAEEHFGGDVVRARLQDLQGAVRTAEEAQPQPREEFEATVDSICKHVKELGAVHVAESDVGEIFLPGRSAKLGSAFSELPGAVVDLRYGWDLASAAGRQECWKTLHAERPELVIGSPPSRRHSPWIKDAVPSIDGKQSVEYTFSTNIHGELPRGTWTA